MSATEIGNLEALVMWDSTKNCPLWVALLKEFLHGLNILSGFHLYN